MGNADVRTSAHRCGPCPCVFICGIYGGEEEGGEDHRNIRMNNV